MTRLYFYMRLLYQYFFFRLVAKSSVGHGIHSPFMYDFSRHVLHAKVDFPEKEKINYLRKSLRKNFTKVNLTGFGASQNKNNLQTIRSIYKSASISPKYGELLYRTIQYFKPTNVIELGTSLGVGTAYIALTSNDIKVISLEGEKELVAIARHNFEDMGIRNIDVIEGDFTSSLTNATFEINNPYVAYIDGNHTYQATLAYYQYFTNLKKNNSVLVFDDIRWSNEMELAWKTICKLENGKVTLDLFRMGIVFIKKGLSAQHYRIKF